MNEYYDIDLVQEESDTNFDQYEGCCSRGCMNCLDLDWRDFY